MFAKSSILDNSQGPIYASASTNYPNPWKYNPFSYTYIAIKGAYKLILIKAWAYIWSFKVYRYNWYETKDFDFLPLIWSNGFQSACDCFHFIQS